jgi:c-di-GMP-binding flagellar brake protein YcgR
MKESQLLKLDQAIQLLCDAADTDSPAVISYLKNGKWQIANSTLSEVTGTGLEIELTPGSEIGTASLPINQPVGVSLRFEHIKYIFETRITAATKDISDDGNRGYTLALPDRIEMMQRRAYSRVPTPRAMNVSVTLWHRGYNDSHTEQPAENYWQANLVDLSAGGLLMCINPDSSQFFKQNQYLGLQFTPMYYQKPIALEGKINRLEKCDITGRLNIAVEFLGLEASSEGRDKIHRLISVVNAYSMQNKGLGTVDASDVAANETADPTEVDAAVHEQAVEFSE